MERSFTEHVAHIQSAKDWKVGDRIRITVSGRTGTIIAPHRRHVGFKVRWDEPMFGVTEGWVRVHNMERIEDAS